jgi:hypothetical protein
MVNILGFAAMWSVVQFFSSAWQNESNHAQNTNKWLQSLKYLQTNGLGTVFQ